MLGIPSNVTSVVDLGKLLYNEVETCTVLMSYVLWPRYMGFKFLSYFMSYNYGIHIIIIIIIIMP